MKRIIISLFIGLFIVMVCSACALNLNIRFVDRFGEDLTFVTAPVPKESGAFQVPSERESGMPEPTAALPSVDETTSEAEQITIPSESVTEETSALPELTSKEDILAFYRSAVQRVRSGEAGYGKKTWESVQVSQLTGVAAVDSFINTELNKRATPEAEAETVY